MAAAPKVEVTRMEAVFAVIFVIFVVGMVAAAAAGLLANPLVWGLIITITVALIFVGHILVQRGILSRATLPVWYVLVGGLVLITYGMIEAGYLPVAFQVAGVGIFELELTSALFYTLVIAAILAAIVAVYYFVVKPRPAATS